MRKPNYMIVSGCSDEDSCLLIRDLGPWDRHLTITNCPEIVVEELAGTLRGRRLEYIDSEGQRDQLLVRDGRFDGFALAQAERGD